MDSLQLATLFLEPSLKGKYIHLNAVVSLLESFKNVFKISEIGTSVQEKSIFKVEIGSGQTKILVWSQMHGNEPTTTKALFDFFNFLASDLENASLIRGNFTLVCIPILNPDGAQAYTRENANGVDLNRDAVGATQPEMQLLKSVYESFQPDYCYNLHDQRTIFGTDGFRLPATLSFLAPAFNEEREYNDVRMKAVTVINRMNSALQGFIPNQIGRFDDGYNMNCTGDYFTTQRTPTILFEAGYYQEDYQREESRKYVFIALLHSFIDFNENVLVDKELGDYLRIPQNNKRFFDIIYKKVKIIQQYDEKIINFAAQYQEVLIDGEIYFDAIITKIGDLDDYFGHIEYDCDSLLFSSNGKNHPQIGRKASFSLADSIPFENGIKIVD